MEFLLLLLILVITVISSVTIWFNLPGSVLMLFFIFMLAWISQFAIITPGELSFIFIVVLLLELLEFGLSGLAATYTGAQKRSAYLAVVGGMVGTILLGTLFFIVGAVLGLFVGSYLGAFIGERQSGRSKAEARKVALGALLGSITGKVMKSAMTVVIGLWVIKEVV